MPLVVAAEGDTFVDFFLLGLGDVLEDVDRWDRESGEGEVSLFFNVDS